MKKEIILIDYENIQDIDLKPLQSADVLVKVFHGEIQKFSGDFMNLALALGKERIEMIKISGNGKNALDFHIAYYIGKLVKEFEKPSFYIVTKDSGFIPLVRHLNQKEKVNCALIKSISELELFKPAVNPDSKVKHEIVINKLLKTRVPKPKRKKTLKNRIMDIFKNEIPDSEAEEIIQELIDCHFISCDKEAITYN